MYDKARQEKQTQKAQASKTSSQCKLKEKTNPARTKCRIP